MLTATMPTTATAKMTNMHDEHDEDAGHDEDDASILELGTESRPRRNKSNSVQRRSGQRYDRVLAEPTTLSYSCLNIRSLSSKVDD
jgi:hypothetical protein